MASDSCARERPLSPDDDRSLPAVGRRTRLTILSRSQAALLAVLGSALVVCATEPATTGDAAPPCWESPIEHPGLWTAAFAPDGRRLATAGDDGSVAVWQVGRGLEKRLCQDPARPVRLVAFAPDGATLAASDYGFTVTLWDVATGAKRATLTHPSSLQCLAFSPDGRTLATGGVDQAIRLWDLGSSQVRATLLGHGRPVCALAFAPDGRTLASGCAGGVVKLWDVSGGRGRERHEMRFHRGPVWCLAFSPDGSLLASGGVHKLWEIATGIVSTLPGTQRGFTHGLAFSGDGRTLISARSTGVIQLWDIAEGREIASRRTDRTARSWVVSRDGRFVVGAVPDTTLRIWDLAALLPPCHGAGQ